MFLPSQTPIVALPFSSNFIKPVDRLAHRRRYIAPSFAWKRPVNISKIACQSAERHIHVELFLLVQRKHQQRMSRGDDHILLAFAHITDGIGVDPATGLKTPQQVALLCVKRKERACV